MGEFGSVAMGWWKLHAPVAYDALSDPAAQLGELDAELEEWVAVEADRRQAGHPGESRAFSLAQAREAARYEQLPRMLPDRENAADLSDEFGDGVQDPYGRFSRFDPALGCVLPPGSHLLWRLLLDPQVPASVVQSAYWAWLKRLPRASWTETVGDTSDSILTPVAVETLVCVREQDRAGSRIERGPGATVVTTDTPAKLNNAFELLRVSVAAGRPWATAGTIDRSEPALLLRPLVDDGSDPDPASLAEFEQDCGELERGTQYVVSAGDVTLVDYVAACWRRQSPRITAVRPWLLLDIDGAIAPLDTPAAVVPDQVIAWLDELSSVFDLAWATSWTRPATVLPGLGSRMPIVPVISGARVDPDGYDFGRAIPVLEFANGRPFAWVEDQIGIADAHRLTTTHECVVVRPNPWVGIRRSDVDALLVWASSPRRTT